jgi:glycosyltransferase involved in cell wall biosynthesis
VSLDLNRRVFIILGVYQADPILLSRQLESLASQTHRHLEVLVCPDGPLDPITRAVVEAFASFPIRVLGFDTRVGIHANFARGLREAVAASQSDSDLFAFCDQDDFWYPRKLERQVACFADEQTSLCHSDARIVSHRQDVLAESLFRHEARSRAASFADLLIMNSVTGMTSVFRRDIAIAAQPFPLSGCRYILHDHWLALVASLHGRVRFIDEPLVDYTRHSGNAKGAQEWQGSLRRTSPPRGRIYIHKCYRQFFWRHRALDELRRMSAHIPGAKDRLFGSPIRALFDCDSSRMAGLALSFAYRLRRQRRQADQIWRIWRGKLLYCKFRTAKP